MSKYFLDSSAWRGSDRFILFHDRRVLVHEQGFLWSPGQALELIREDAPQLLVRETESGRCLAARLRPELETGMPGELLSLRGLLLNCGYEEFSVAGLGGQLLEWDRTHRFCGACGGRTEQHGAERALVCSHCQLHFYPRINPCVIMLITRGSRLLLARNARFKGGFHSCLAGFVEPGETPEQTLAREVREEVGIEIHNIQYRRSQSWPFPSQLMLGFTAEYLSGELCPDGIEIDAADWFEVDALPPVPDPRISVAGQLIAEEVARLGGEEKAEKV